jgi:hypothetical protein
MLRSLLKIVAPDGQATAPRNSSGSQDIDPALTGRVSALESSLVWATDVVETRQRERAEAGEALEHTTAERERAEHAFDAALDDDRTRDALAKAQAREDAARRALTKAGKVLSEAEAELTATRGKLDAAQLEVRKAELRAVTDLAGFLERAEKHARVIDAAIATIKEHAASIDAAFEVTNAAADELSRMGERTDRLHIRLRWYPLLALRVASNPALAAAFVSLAVDCFASPLSESLLGGFATLVPKKGTSSSAEFTAAALERFESWKKVRR